MKQAGTRVAEQIATVTVWALAAVIIGTPLGVWVKLFWVDWVFQLCGK